MKSQEDEVRAVHVAWIEAVNAGELARLLTLMSDDAVFLAPGREPVGRARFAVDFAAAHEKLRIRCVSELREVVVAGTIAHAWSRDVVSVAPREGGESTELAGSRLTVYRREADGRWLLARDAHTLTPAEGKSPP